MGLQLYKSNKSVKGCAAGFSFNSKDGAMFVSLVKQTGYDEARHIGSFKDGAKINIKLGLSELGAMLDCFDSNREFSTVHATESYNTGIKLAPYITDKDGSKVQRGFGLFINKSSKGENANKESFLLTINFGEAKLISEYIKFVLDHCFSAIYSADQKEYKERQDKKNGTQEQPPAPKKSIKSEKQKVTEEYIPSEKTEESAPAAESTDETDGW